MEPDPDGRGIRPTGWKKESETDWFLPALKIRTSCQERSWNTDPPAAALCGEDLVPNELGGKQKIASMFASGQLLAPSQSGLLNCRSTDQGHISRDPRAEFPAELEFDLGRVGPPWTQDQCPQGWTKNPRPSNRKGTTWLMAPRSQKRNKSS